MLYSRAVSMMNASIGNETFAPVAMLREASFKADWTKKRRNAILAVMSNTARTLPPDDDETAEFIAAVKEGIADADAGRLIPYEDIRPWLLSWGTENELPPPE